MSRQSMSKLMTVSLVLLLIGAIAFGINFMNRRPDVDHNDLHAAADENEADATTSASEEPKSGNSHLEPIEFPKKLWSAAGIVVSPVRNEPLSEEIQLTGKVSLNEERIAHVFPLVDGRVDEVHVQLGQRVKKGTPLVVIQSKEVGERMLQLFQDRLRLSFAETKREWMKDVGINTLALIEEMRAGTEIDAIEKKFKSRPMGNYREQLMTPYITIYRASIHLDRLMPLSRDGAVAGRQVVEAQSDRDAARAVLESMLEQVSQDVRQAVQLTEQAVEEARASVTVAEANLRILGYSNEELNQIDPVQDGDALAHYVITAPFDGTVISKDVVMMERVGPEQQILTIADLSTVWATGDIYESQLPILSQLEDQTIEISSNAFPGRTLTARIFYTGDVVEDATRTIALRAVAENAEGLLRPGMFITLKLPRLHSAEVLQVPASAIQDHEGRPFVFVQTGEEQFQRKDVTLGRRNQNSVEVLSGVTADDQVVSAGGFALKSKMLADLLEE